MRRVSAWVVRLAAGLGLLLAVWAVLIGPRWLSVREVSLPLSRWPTEHAGLRVALLSDLHVGSLHWGPERIRELVQTTNAQKPDLILLAGDYMIDDVLLGTKVDPEAIAAALSGLRARMGVIAVLGNHDWWNDGPRMASALTHAGIVVLEDGVQRVPHAGGEFYVVGLADQMTRPKRLEHALGLVPEGKPFLLLVHEPDVFPEIDCRPALTLAGHTHGGQVALPILGRPIVPSVFGERFAAGHVVEDDRHLFVTTGIGTSIWPIRLGVPPELVILTLQSGLP
jgi:predicted MPP superfamily phosphohydrolase